MRSTTPLVVCILTLVLPLLLLAVVTSAGESRLALGGADPVLLIKGEEVAGEENRAEVHQGFTYRFAGEKTQNLFRDNPERFAIQFEGSCARMRSAAGNPAVFTVHDEKIYIFGGESCREEFVADPPRYLNFDDRMNIAIMLYPGVELLDFAGPGEVFAAADHGRAFEVYTVGLSTEPMISQGFVRIVPEYSVNDAPRPDVVVIPGGSVGSLMGDKAAMAWVRQVSDEATILSVCNGALALAELGLLDGLEATTHHGSIKALRESSEKIRVHADARFVDNGRIITSAGVSAGIDAALHLVGRLLTPETARSTALYMEYDWRPELMKEHSVQRTAAAP